MLGIDLSRASGAGAGVRLSQPDNLLVKNAETGFGVPFFAPRHRHAVQGSLRTSGARIRSNIRGGKRFEKPLRTVRPIPSAQRDQRWVEDCTKSSPDWKSRRVPSSEPCPRCARLTVLASKADTKHHRCRKNSGPSASAESRRKDVTVWRKQ